MADPASPPPQKTSTVIIPPEIQEKFPDLVSLILGSESMNDEERQYWINILLVMTPEQRDNLKDILETERRQLKEIDQKYAKEIQEMGQEKVIEQTRKERTQRRSERTQVESQARDTEEKQAASILESIEESASQKT
ncbi:MAG: hypothetical protein V1926_04250 [Candidatus Peregrinibacteria bacterium]